MRDDAEDGTNCRLIGNECRCRLAGPLFLTEHDAEEDGEQYGGQDASLLDVVGDGEAARQRPIVFHMTLLAFMELVEEDEKSGRTAKAR